MHEADAERASAALEEQGCGERAALALRDLCSATEASCELSSELRDRDATARCLAGTDRCQGARERFQARCAKGREP